VVERLPPLPGWPTSNRIGRDQIGISGRLHSGIGGRLPPEYAADTLGPAIRRLISAEFILCLAPEDQPYFRRSREAALAPRSKNIVRIDRAGSPNSSRLSRRSKRPSKNNRTLAARRPRTPITCSSRLFSTRGSAVLKTLFPLVARCARGVTAWRWRSTGSEIAIRHTPQVSPKLSTLCCALDEHPRS
jgi:hypothetical protein